MSGSLGIMPIEFFSGITYPLNHGPRKIRVVLGDHGQPQVVLDLAAQRAVTGCGAGLDDPEQVLVPALEAYWYRPSLHGEAGAPRRGLSLLLRTTLLRRLGHRGLLFFRSVILCNTQPS